MNREIVCAWPRVGLLLTWCTALLAYRLIPDQDQVSALLFWSTLPALYGGALWVGHRKQASRSAGLQWLRLAIVLVGCVLAWLVNVALYDIAGALFFCAAMVQVSLGVTLKRERGLYASLIISVLMLGFAASRPRSDTPLLLMMVPFFTAFVLTLVANQFSQGQRHLAPRASVRHRLGRLTAGLVALVLVFAVGIAMVSVTPMGSMGPLQWQLDRDFLFELAGGSSSDSAASTAGRALGPGKGPSGNAFASTLRAELGKANTVGELLSALGAALAAGARQLLGGGGGQSFSSSLAAPSFPWWLALLPLLLYRVRLWLRVRADRALYAAWGRGPASPLRMRRLSAAVDRLLEARGLARAPSQTWREFARIAPVSESQPRMWLSAWAAQHEEQHYRGAARRRNLESGLPDRLGELYLALFETVRRTRQAPRKPLRARLGSALAVLSPSQARALGAWTGQLRTRLERLRARVHR